MISPLSYTYSFTRTCACTCTYFKRPWKPVFKRLGATLAWQRERTEFDARFRALPQFSPWVKRSGLNIRLLTDYGPGGTSACVLVKPGFQKAVKPRLDHGAAVAGRQA